MVEIYLKNIVEFFNHPVFIIVGGTTVVIGFLGFLYKVISWFFGITPIVIRLGTALWKRKVAIFGTTDAFTNLKDTLIDSKIFTTNSIIHINLNNIDKAKGETVFLVDWETCADKIDHIFSVRLNHQTAIVIYAKPASIPHEKMNDIANRPNTVVVNFRGRLLNDILTSLITTSYDGK